MGSFGGKVSELTDLQHKFTLMVADLIQEAARRGYKVALGEAHRTPEQARLNAKKGSGISNSLHCERLAIDLILRKNELYLTDSYKYQELGEWWESKGGAWGGRFKRPDGNHFSLAYGGRR